MFLILVWVVVFKIRRSAAHSLIMLKYALQCGGHSGDGISYCKHQGQARLAAFSFMFVCVCHRAFTLLLGLFHYQGQHQDQARRVLTGVYICVYAIMLCMCHGLFD